MLLSEKPAKLALAMEEVISFDGTKSMLNDFCNRCNRAMSLVEKDLKSRLFVKIRHKIIGEAKALIRNRAFSDWPALENYLQEVFSEKWSHGQWQLKFASCQQEINEDVIFYARRIDDCFINILHNIPTDREQCKERITFLRNLMLDCFIVGLRKELSSIVKSEKPNTFEDAVRIARKIETTLEESEGTSSSAYGSSDPEDYENRPDNVSMHSDSSSKMVQNARHIKAKEQQHQENTIDPSTEDKSSNERENDLLYKDSKTSDYIIKKGWDSKYNSNAFNTNAYFDTGNLCFQIFINILCFVCVLLTYAYLYYRNL